MILAGGVGLPVQRAAVGEADLDRPRRQRCAVLIARDHVRLDRLAAIDHALLDVEAQVDRLELVGLDLETARENALARLGDRDAIRAQRRGGVERQRLVERAEVREGHGAGDDQPAAAIGDLEAVDRLRDVGILAFPDLAHHAADRDLLTRTIGRPVGVDVRARTQSLGDLIGHGQMRARDIRAVQDQVAQARDSGRGGDPSCGPGRRPGRSSPRARPGRHRRRGPARRPGRDRSSCPGRRRGPDRATS